jgi:Peptidase family M23
MSSSRDRLSALGCHIAPSVGVSVGNVGDGCLESPHKIINVDERAVTVSTGSEGGAMADQPPINDHRPVRLTADRRYGPALVASRLESLSRIGEFHLADAKQRPQLGPGNLRVTTNDDEQVAAGRVADDDRLCHLRGTDTEQLGRLLEVARGGSAAQLNSEPALIRVSKHATYTCCQVIAHDQSPSWRWTRNSKTMHVAVESRPPVRLLARARPWLAVTIAAIILALIPLIGLQLFLAVPLIGLALSAGTPPDYVTDAKPVDRRPRNIVLGVVILICLGLVVLLPQLTLGIVVLFGLDMAGLVVSLIAVAALVPALTMADSATGISELPQRQLVFTRRNLLLCLTAALTVATWYAGPGLSYVPIAALVVGLPIPLAVSRLLAVRRGRLELGLLRRPLGHNLLLHRLQFVNMLVLCGLLAATLFTGAYDPTAFDFSTGGYRVVLIAFLGGLLVLLLAAAIPLKHVRAASNLLLLGGTLFVAAQLLMTYRPAANPVPIASPLADAWVVGQGGHSELVNYHYVTSTQRDALDIRQYRGSSTHQPGSTELASYYIYGKPVLAPADGTVTFVLDGRPDQQIGSTDRGYQAGNNVVIDIGNGHFLQMGHLSPGSIRVKFGDHGKLGQPIAKVGNSGNTTQPHLHIQAQTVGTGIGDVATMDAPAVLRTLHTIPLVFTDVVLTRRGVESEPAYVDPRRGDLVGPAS